MTYSDRKKLLIIFAISGHAWGGVYSWNDIENVSFTPLPGVNYLCRSIIRHDNEKPVYIYGFVSEDGGSYKCQISLAASSTFREGENPDSVRQFSNFTSLDKDLSSGSSYKLYEYMSDQFSIPVDQHNAPANVNFTPQQISRLITYTTPHYPKPIGQVSRLYQAHKYNITDPIDMSRPPELDNRTLVAASDVGLGHTLSGAYYLCEESEALCNLSNCANSNTEGCAEAAEHHPWKIYNGVLWHCPSGTSVHEATDYKGWAMDLDNDGCCGTTFRKRCYPCQEGTYRSGFPYLYRTGLNQTQCVGFGNEIACHQPCQPLTVCQPPFEKIYNGTTQYNTVCGCEDGSHPLILSAPKAVHLQHQVEELNASNDIELHDTANYEDADINGYIDPYDFLCIANTIPCMTTNENGESIQGIKRADSDNCVPVNADSSIAPSSTAPSSTAPSSTAPSSAAPSSSSSGPKQSSTQKSVTLETKSSIYSFQISSVQLSSSFASSSQDVYSTSAVSSDSGISHSTRIMATQSSEYDFYTSSIEASNTLSSDSRSIDYSSTAHSNSETSLTMVIESSGYDTYTSTIQPSNTPVVSNSNSDIHPTSTQLSDILSRSSLNSEAVTSSELIPQSVIVQTDSSVYGIISSSAEAQNTTESLDAIKTTTAIINFPVESNDPPTTSNDYYWKIMIPALVLVSVITGSVIIVGGGAVVLYCLNHKKRSMLTSRNLAYDIQKLEFNRYEKR